MQSMTYDVRSLYRWYQDGTVPSEHGGAVAEWKRGRMHRLSFYPMSSMRTQTEFGIQEDIMWKVIVNDTSVFRVGDCIGNAEERLYKVESVRTYQTSQQMEVKEIWQARS